jgi:galactose-1-phosphate uridylyltransferase
MAGKRQKPKGVISLKTLEQLVDRDLMKFAGKHDELLQATKVRGELSLWFFTAAHTYHVVAHSTGCTYLGCMATSRVCQAGSDELVRKQLAHGPLTRATWQAIKDDMLAHALVQVGHPDHNAERLERVRADTKRILLGRKGRGSLTARPVDRAALAEYRRRS